MVTINKDRLKISVIVSLFLAGILAGGLSYLGFNVSATGASDLSFSLSELPVKIDNILISYDQNSNTVFANDKSLNYEDYIYGVRLQTLTTTDVLLSVREDVVKKYSVYGGGGVVGDPVEYFKSTLQGSGKPSPAPTVKWTAGDSTTVITSAVKGGAVALYTTVMADIRYKDYVCNYKIVSIIKNSVGSVIGSSDSGYKQLSTDVIATPIIGWKTDAPAGSLTGYGTVTYRCDVGGSTLYAWSENSKMITITETTTPPTISKPTIDDVKYPAEVDIGKSPTIQVKATGANYVLVSLGTFSKYLTFNSATGYYEGSIPTNNIQAGSNSVYIEASNTAGITTKTVIIKCCISVQPPICPTVCVSMWKLKQVPSLVGIVFQCQYIECGSGCGPDNIQTFNTKSECERMIPADAVLGWVIQNNQCVYVTSGAKYNTEAECKAALPPITPGPTGDTVFCEKENANIPKDEYTTSRCVPTGDQQQNKTDGGAVSVRYCALTDSYIPIAEWSAAKCDKQPGSGGSFDQNTFLLSFIASLAASYIVLGSVKKK